MSDSSDEAPSAPGPNVENAAPSATVEDAPANGDPSAAPPSGEEQQQPRRRHRRRRRRPPSVAAPPATPVGDESLGVSSGEPAADEAPAAAGASADPSPEAQGPRPHEPRPFGRRRRWRRGPPRDAAAPPSLPAADANPSPEPTAVVADGTPAAGEAVPGTAGQPHRPRRRRRRPPRPADAAAPGSAGETSSGSEPGAEPASRQTAGDAGRPRTGRPYPQRPRGAGLQERDPRARRPRQARGQDAGPRSGSGREPDRRDRGREDRARRDRGGRSPRRDREGRGREGPPRKQEQKLYALESVVDRGFDDVPDEADEGSTRRVHWTIVKRTVADQKTGKAMSARYALQREGVESEFPNLGAARAAVNKTIVHPEKLTLSKAEHVAAKGSR